VFLQGRRNDKVTISESRGLGQDLITVERGTVLVFTENVDEAERVSRVDLRLRFERLDPGGVVEDVAELALVDIELLFAQIETSKAGNVGDVDVDGHERRV
jgi:hypothetical protein